MNEIRKFDGYEIHSLGGMCQVQGEGRVDGYPFYFRSRGTSWSFEVCKFKSAPVDYCSWPEMVDVFRGRQKYSNEPYSAGYISIDEALAFIAKGVEEFRKSL